MARRLKRQPSDDRRFGLVCATKGYGLARQPGNGSTSGVTFSARSVPASPSWPFDTPASPVRGCPPTPRVRHRRLGLWAESDDTVDNVECGQFQSLVHRPSSDSQPGERFDEAAVDLHGDHGSRLVHMVTEVVVVRALIFHTGRTVRRTGQAVQDGSVRPSPVAAKAILTGASCQRCERLVYIVFPAPFQPKRGPWETMPPKSPRPGLGGIVAQHDTAVACTMRADQHGEAPEERGIVARPERLRREGPCCDDNHGPHGRAPGFYCPRCLIAR